MIFFKGNEILRIEKCFINKVINGKQYYLFGDGLNYTDKDMTVVTDVGFAVAYAGQILVIQKPSTVTNLSVHDK